MQQNDFLPQNPVQVHKLRMLLCIRAIHRSSCRRESLEIYTFCLGIIHKPFNNIIKLNVIFKSILHGNIMLVHWRWQVNILLNVNWIDWTLVNCLTFFVLLRFICVFVEYSELIKSKSICLPRRGDCRLFESMQVSSKFKWFSIFKWLLVPVIIQCHFVSRLDYKIWPYDVLFWALSCWNPCNFIRKVLDNLFEWQVQMPI